MTRRRTIAALAAMLPAMGSPACDETAEGAGQITVSIGYAGVGGAPVAGFEGVITLDAGGERRRIPFADRMDQMAGSISVAALDLEGLDPGAGPPTGSWSRFAVHDGLACDPAAGPVAVTVELSPPLPAPPSGLVPFPTAARHVTIPCDAGWERGGAVSFTDISNPLSAGELRVRVVLDAPPAGATEATAVVKVRPATEVSAGSDEYPPFEVVRLLPDGGRLVGVWSSPCVGDWTRRAFVDVGALTVPGLDPHDVWRVWPPPGRATGDVACVVGQVREVEVHLTRR